MCGLRGKGSGMDNRLIVAIIAAMGSPIVLAADYTDEQDYFEEQPVVLSASRLAQPQSDAPNAMTVIDRAMIKASGIRTFTDLLRLVPGMEVNYQNGHLPIVAYHGALDNYSRQMQILIDGRSVYLPPTSSVSWESIPLQIDDIERIEVVRGPAAASHGANSFQGVVNIITRDAASVHGADATVNKGSDGVSDAALHWGKTGSAWDYRATLAYQADNGYATPLLNDDMAMRMINLRAAYHPNASDSFDMQMGYSADRSGLGIAGRPTDPFVDTRSYSSFGQFSWVHALPQLDELKLNYYHSHLNYSYSVVDFSNILVPLQDIIDRDELELQHTTQWSAANRLVWGAGVRRDVADSFYWLSGVRTINQSRLFAHDEWRVTKRTVMNGGAMLEKDGMGHTNTSPRASLNYHFSPQHTVRIGTSVAYRNPAMAEEYGNLTGVLLSLGGVKPEKIFSREIGYLGELGTGMSVDARIYYDKVRDIIYFDQVPNTGLPLSFTNVFGATYRGFETTIKYRWQEHNNLTFNFSRQYASCEVTGTLMAPGDPSIWNSPSTSFTNLEYTQGIAASCVSMVPYNSGSILYAREMAEDIRFSAAYYHQGQMQFWDTLAPITIQRRLDLKIAKTLGLPGQAEGEVAFIMQNVLGDNYTDYGATYVSRTLGSQQYGKRDYLAVTLKF